MSRKERKIQEYIEKGLNSKPNFDAVLDKLEIKDKPVFKTPFYKNIRVLIPSLATLLAVAIILPVSIDMAKNKNVMSGDMKTSNQEASMNVSMEIVSHEIENSEANSVANSEADSEANSEADNSKTSNDQTNSMSSEVAPQDSMDEGTAAVGNIPLYGIDATFDENNIVNLVIYTEGDYQIKEGDIPGDLYYLDSNTNNQERKEREVTEYTVKTFVDTFSDLQGEVYVINEGMTYSLLSSFDEGDIIYVIQNENKMYLFSFDPS